MKSEYVSYQPVYQQGEQLVVSEAPISAQLQKNIKTVFKVYDIPYKEDNQGILLISKEIWEDIDIVWNYTTKANDPEWLSTHS